MSYQFKSSRKLTLGLEMELQIINPLTLNLASRAKDLMRYIQRSPHAEKIKPEITQGMIELNSTIHDNPTSLQTEMLSLSLYLKHISSKFNVNFCGGGTHPFQKWSVSKIFPSTRFRHHVKRYGYLSKRFTVFSMHVHVGCKNGDDAIYLTHMLSRYVPQLITLSASSPFYQGVRTDYHSTRLNVVNAFPLSGHMPNLKNWEEFKKYYLKMCDLKVVESMKDFYWDIRPKPEFGTVEIRVCDMPLTLQKAVTLSAYMQSLAAYILHERPYQITDDIYQVYDYNRFQAIRSGYEGDFINPFTYKHTTIHKDIQATLRYVEPFAKSLGNEKHIKKIKEWVKDKDNDAMALRAAYKKEKSLEYIVRQECKIWNASLKL